jgi:hypothetical protein
LCTGCVRKNTWKSKSTVELTIFGQFDFSKIQ